MGFQKVTEPKVGKNRIHFDVVSPDPAADQERVEALGGQLLPQFAAGGFLVMADPEGNEFCIIPEGPFDLDDDGRASYLSSGPDRQTRPTPPELPASPTTVTEPESEAVAGGE